MKKLILIALLSIQLLSQNTNKSNNPTVYSSLGDKIYNNAQKIENLQIILEYEYSINKIRRYIKNVKKAKEIGFEIQAGNKDVDKSEYLNLLRKLSSTNDYFVYSINNHFKKSMKNEDTELFVYSVNSGLVSILKNKRAMRKYYKKHKKEIDEQSSTLGDIINSKNKKPIYRGLTKAQLEEIEIRRIRRIDREKQEEIERSLEEEVIRKKVEIREEQKRELESISN